MKMMFAVASPMTSSPAFTLLKQKKKDCYHVTLDWVCLILILLKELSEIRITLSITAAGALLKNFDKTITINFTNILQTEMH